MMNVDTASRYSFERIKLHPWYTRKNPLLTQDGKMADPLGMATQMLENLHIDFSQKPSASQRPPRHTQSQDAMDVDSVEQNQRFASTQPEAPINDVMFDWERPPRISAAFSSTQPTNGHDASLRPTAAHMIGFDSLADEPSMSQFAPAPTVSLSLTQHARQFRDIVPSYSLTRFFSHLAAPHLLQLLSTALHQLNVPTPPSPLIQGRDHAAWFKIKTVDGRQCGLTGDIVIDTYITNDVELLEVRFIKVKGDPLEWRRFFKM